MAIPVDAAAAALREAMRETVKRYSLWYLIQGVLLVIAGVLAIVSPVIASVAVVFLLGWILIVSGALQAIGLIGASHVPHFWLQLISAVLAALIGVLLLRSPESSLLVMTMLLIVYFMVEGLAKVIFALTIRPFPNWGWVLASGFLGIVLSSLLWTNMPLSAEWLLGFMLGLLLISEGAALAYLAWRVRTAPPVTDN
ncbi:HdeD family acid-resistance protein [Methyloceanibacter sp.]|uniref:HdeD family acid-resistance protein n=1 Tax=Methyloceanibacter sp. TaxID=1965321 RepID=UPI00208A294A|nr:HdeD family acid-resistance protein [Methyloceanibacter sp.]GFO81364.1 MAG: membrane protein [Methyloceanibacter sp.]HML91455.1 HdeD family acid-resistance protein [Methyloceanibacter sp.]